MNKEGEDFYYIEEGFVIPAFIGDTWTVKVGKASDGTRISFSFAPADGSGHWKQLDYYPINGRLATPNGATSLTSNMKGPLNIVRGTINMTGYFRVNVTSDQDNDIDVHIQVGTNAYVGVISTKDSRTFLIEEEMTLADLLNDC